MNILIAIFLFVAIYFGITPHTAYAQADTPNTQCPNFKIWVIDKNGNRIEAPNPFTDDNLQKIEYDITLNLKAVVRNKIYFIYNDSLLGHIDEKTVEDINGDIGHLRGTFESNTASSAFSPDNHRLIMRYQDTTAEMCIAPYIIEKGLTQQPIRCTLTPLSSLPNNYMSVVNDFIVNVDISPDSKVQPEGITYPGLRPMDKRLISFNRDTNEQKIIRDWRDFKYVNDYKYVVPIPAGLIPLPGHYHFIAEFYYGIALSKAGECISSPFTLCEAGSSDPACLFPTNTPTPSLTPTDSPRCQGCTIQKCNQGGTCDVLNCLVCRPTYTPPPPFPSLQPICDSLGQGAGSDCRKCIEDGGKLWTAIGCVPSNMGEFVKDYVFVYGVGIAGGIAFLYFIYGCFLILTSAGNAERVEEAKAIITSALSGLLLIIFSVVLLRIIGVDILRLPGFG